MTCLLVLRFKTIMPKNKNDHILNIMLFSINRTFFLKPNTKGETFQYLLFSIQ